MRVQVPIYTSAFITGARTGTVVSTGWLHDMGADRKGKVRIARVLLDKTKRTILCDLGDCTPIKENDHAS